MVQSAGSLRGVNLSDAFTRPDDSDPYAIGDLIANSTTLADVVALAFGVRHKTTPFAIKRVKLSKSSDELSGAKFRVHLFTQEPTPTNADNAAFETGKDGYLGPIDITVDQAFGDGSVGFGEPDIGWEVLPSTMTRGKLYALIEARDEYGPEAEEIFTVELELS